MGRAGAEVHDRVDPVRSGLVNEDAARRIRPAEQIAVSRAAEQHVAAIAENVVVAGIAVEPIVAAEALKATRRKFAASRPNRALAKTMSPPHWPTRWRGRSEP